MLKNIFRRKISTEDLPTVTHVDVERYCGTWYEIASVPSARQKNCTDTKAEYTLAPGGYVKVRNSCKRKGRKASVDAKAYPEPGSGNARLVVRFFRFIKAGYLVIDLADDYSWAVVANPEFTKVWVLSRTPYPSAIQYREILDKISTKGFDVNRLKKTDHDR